MKGSSQKLIILLKLLHILENFPLLLLISNPVQLLLALLDMLIQHRVGSQDGVYVISQEHGTSTFFFSLLEELLGNLPIEFGEVDVFLNYLVKSPVEFVFVEVGSLSKTRPRELV
jgi:hypothetical protein